MLNSRGIGHEILPQNLYIHGIGERAALTRDIVKAMTPETQEGYRKFKKFNKRAKDEDLLAETLIRTELARDLIKAQTEGMIKAGMTTSLGYNFFDLRGPAYLIYPVNTPFRNSLPRHGRVNDGYGTAANWKATRNFGTQYAGVLEGQRNALATPDENNYIATYKEIGVERGASFTSQFAGEGYTDNVADEHLRGMHELWLGEEGLMIGGNSGTAAGNNGFVLGTANTPTATLVVAAGLIPNATNVSCRVVELAMLANPQNTQYGYGLFPTVASGLTPSYVRTNYDGSTTTINGGMGQISAASNVVVTAGGSNQVKFAVTPKAGAVAWAWYVDVTDASSPSAANAILSGITNVPSFTYNLAAPAGTQLGNAAGLNTDHSFNTADFDGLLSYSASLGIWVNLFSGTTQNLGGITVPASTAGLTPMSNGRILEFERILQSLWNQFQAPVQTIWCSADAKNSAGNAIMNQAGNTPTAFHFNYTRDAQDKIMGGFVVDAYKTQYAMDPSGAQAIPLRIHPMLPPGTFYFDISENPYPSSRLPFVRGMLVQRDYYSIEWPLVTRQWTFGTYCHEVLAHNVPWITAVLTGVTPT